MDHDRHAGLDRQIGEDPRMEDEDHGGIEAVDCLRDRLPGCLADEAEEPGRDRRAGVEKGLGVPSRTARANVRLAAAMSRR